MATPGQILGCTTLIRLDRSTYIAGEEVTGTVAILAPEGGLKEDIRVEEAVLRAHGHIRVDPRWISLPGQLRTLYGQGEKEPDGEVNGTHKNSLPNYKELDDVNTACVFHTAPVVIMKDQPLSQQEQEPTGDLQIPLVHSFRFYFRLPPSLPPSFKGVSVKYLYAVTISVSLTRPQRNGWGPRGLIRSLRQGAISTIRIEKDVHLPFAVLPGAATTAAARHGRVWLPSSPASPAQSSLQAERIEERSPLLNGEESSSPYSTAALLSQTSISMWDLQGKGGGEGPGMYAGEGEPAPPPQVYSIRSGESKIARFIMYKKEYLPGDLVLGTFDLTGADCPMLQICAALVQEERCGTGGGWCVPVAPPQVTTAAPVHQKILDVFHELTQNVQVTSLTLALPADAPVSLETDLVNIRWVLRFEFTAVAPQPAPVEGSSLEGVIVESTGTGGSVHASPMTGKDVRIPSPSTTTILPHSHQLVQAQPAPPTVVLRWEVPIRVLSPRHGHLIPSSSSSDAPKHEHSFLANRPCDGAVERFVDFYI